MTDIFKKNPAPFEAKCEAIAFGVSISKWIRYFRTCV